MNLKRKEKKKKRKGSSLVCLIFNMSANGVVRGERCIPLPPFAMKNDNNWLMKTTFSIPWRCVMCVCKREGDRERERERVRMCV